MYKRTYTILGKVALLTNVEISAAHGEVESKHRGQIYTRLPPSSNTFKMWPLVSYLSSMIVEPSPYLQFRYCVKQHCIGVIL